MSLAGRTASGAKTKGLSPQEQIAYVRRQAARPALWANTGRPSNVAPKRRRGRKLRPRRLRSLDSPSTPEKGSWNM